MKTPVEGLLDHRRRFAGLDTGFDTSLRSDSTHRFGYSTHRDSTTDASGDSTNVTS
jgi:hypothetical protein